MSSNKKYKNILFNKERDKDILDWLNSLPNQSEAIRAALREAMIKDGRASPEPTLSDILAQIEILSAQISRLKTVSTADIRDDEPDDVVRKLKNFGL